MRRSPRVLSPALPSELLSYIVTQHAYPTTLIICGSRADFVRALVEDVESGSSGKGERQREGAPATETGRQKSVTSTISTPRPLLVSAPLYQVAISRHIRTAFVPTVSHLRAFLSVFSPKDPSSAVRPPPGWDEEATTAQATGSSKGLMAKKEPPLLLIYGLVELHRNTSEWSAQGLSCTLAGLVDAAERASFEAVLVEPRATAGDAGGRGNLDLLLSEDLPILSGSIRRSGLDGRGWTSRAVSIRRVLGRWFRFQDEPWEGG